MSPKKINFPNEKSNRIVLFADLRDSTDILVNFDQGIYQRKEARDMFLKIHQDYGLGAGAVMAQRCDMLDAGSLSRYWDGIWSLKEK